MPLALLLGLIRGTLLRNLALTLVSLVFYTWGEQTYVWIILVSILINYVGGVLLDKVQDKVRRGIFWGSISLHLYLLFQHKYLLFFSKIFHVIPDEIPHLPLGISFFTFQGIAYLYDVYKRKINVEYHPIDLALFISLFPQLIAGPIVRFQTVQKSIKHPKIRLSNFKIGLQKMLVGLFKKVVIADSLARISDDIFSTSEMWGGAISWIAILAFTLQIFFDFSGYSDMAIGLGRMLGFPFPENFNYPYIATSVRDFWRRWHITLSTWFRDYLYIPLGGNQKGQFRTIFHLAIVFLVTGLWHGAGWNFILWGGIHGFALIFERLVRFDQWKIPVVFKWLYLILVVIHSWVFFRIPDFDLGLSFLSSLYRPSLLDSSPHFSAEFYFHFGLGCLFCLPFGKWIYRFLIKNRHYTSYGYFSISLRCIRLVSLVIALYWSILYLSAHTFQPFIYFRF